MILEYVYDLPGTGCQIWVKIYCEFAADPNNPLSARQCVLSGTGRMV